MKTSKVMISMDMFKIIYIKSLNIIISFVYEHKFNT